MLLTTRLHGVTFEKQQVLMFACARISGPRTSTQIAAVLYISNLNGRTAKLWLCKTRFHSSVIKQCNRMRQYTDISFQCLVRTHRVSIIRNCLNASICVDQNCCKFDKHHFCAVADCTEQSFICLQYADVVSYCAQCIMNSFKYTGSLVKGMCTTCDGVPLHVVLASHSDRGII